RARARAAPPGRPARRAATRAPRSCARPPARRPPPPPPAAHTARSRRRRAPRPPGTAPGRSRGRWWCSSPLPTLEARQVLRHQAAVGLGVEIRLDQLRRGRDREIHRLAPQLEDRLLLLTLDLLAGSVEQLLVLVARLGEQRSPLLV